MDLCPETGGSGARIPSLYSQKRGKMKNKRKKCPKCNSTKIVYIEDALTCTKCGFENNNKKEAQFIQYGIR